MEGKMSGDYFHLQNTSLRMRYDSCFIASAPFNTSNAMRIGILSLLHESNTFAPKSTSLTDFQDDLFLHGESILEQFINSHHEVGGFLQGIAADHFLEAVPIVAFRATPSGTITGDTWASLINEVRGSLSAAGPLAGLLVACHGAAVSQTVPDVDGYLLCDLRKQLGPRIPIIGTIDAHANLSMQMVSNCTALIGYRTNPHLDQQARGREAANLMSATVRGEVSPTMAASFPPLIINIDRQCTSDPHLTPIYQYADQQLTQNKVLSNSVLLGFPYADVAEMGTATIAITNNDHELAAQLADDLADEIWTRRDQMRGKLLSVAEAVGQCKTQTTQRTCLLDMGDNVGAGSAADGTDLLAELLRQQIEPFFCCIYDPEAVSIGNAAGVGGSTRMMIGGKSDKLHGAPIELLVDIVSLHDGRFRESRPRHGGIVEFDQGATAIVRCNAPQATIMLTSKRMVPFSLEQLTSFQIDPRVFQVLVAKGVNAPIAAYQEVCDSFIRVNTRGCTSADLSQQKLHQRRRPMYPFEPKTTWQ